MSKSFLHRRIERRSFFVERYLPCSRMLPPSHGISASNLSYGSTPKWGPFRLESFNSTNFDQYDVGETEENKSCDSQKPFIPNSGIIVRRKLEGVIALKHFRPTKRRKLGNH